MDSTRVARVRRALDEIRAGKMVILVDDEDRENEGDLTMAADKVTPEAINFMAKWGRGLICLTLTEERIGRLGLEMMVQNNKAPMGTAFTVSIEARHGVTTGISAADRAVTIKAAVARDARADDLVSPGHIFPLRARKGGVLVRTGQTEGSVDLARMAGLEPAGVICEIMRDDGEMARMPDLEKFAAEHDLSILSIADMIEYRLQTERLVRCVAKAPLSPALLGGHIELVASCYASDVDDTEYVALVHGDVSEAARRGEAVLVRVQQAPLPGDMLSPSPLNVESHVRAALRVIEREGRGVFLFVNHPRPSSLIESFEKYVMGKKAPLGGHASSPGALRDFGLGAQVLADLGLHKVRLLSNNEQRIPGIGGYSIDVVERVPFEVVASDQSKAAVLPFKKVGE
jgi:3,4-dihydroxy 2-butanone 4-phosphate synthase/GTP cyclohydrolase II